MKILIPIMASAIVLASCGSDSNDVPDTASVDSTAITSVAETPEAPRRQFPVAVENGKIWEAEGHKWLFGGEDSIQHFNITGCELMDSQFHFGIGREKFPALLEPAFVGIEEADTMHADSARFLLLQYGETTKAYSVADLTNHEVVNDVIEGKPIMAAYCILADLGAIYDRELGNREYTFALSGYTYHDPEVWDGMDGFVMWDRETESLWWPLIGRSVSGPLKGTEMQVLDEQYWSQTTWDIIKANHPDALVMASGQDFERPTEWPRYTDATPVMQGGQAIAPRWGENGED